MVKFSAPNIEPILFVHIPKTAGSSFRSGMDKALGKDSSLRDYGTKSAETSKEVLQAFYRDADPWALRKALSRKKRRLLVGHVPLMRYVALFGVKRVVTFVRDPVQRVVSEYGHFSRHYGFRGSLLEFARQAPFINKQAKMLKGVPLEAIGLVGLTERYEESLQLFRLLFGVNPPPLEENVGRGTVVGGYSISRREADELRHLNADDLIVYQTATKIFEQRMEAENGSSQFVRGRVTAMENHLLKGWAVWDASDAPVSIEVFADDDLLGVVKATEFRPKASGLMLGRGGYIGFSFELPANVRQTSVRCCVEGTDHFLSTAWDLSVAS